MRALFLSLLAPVLLAAAAPETRIAVTLPPGLASDAGGRLLLFAEPATGPVDAVDADDPAGRGTAVAARDIAGFGADRAVTIDTRRKSFPQGFAALAPGDYHVQAVLDRNRDYAYAGRGPGDIVSRVVTVHFPLATPLAIPLDHVVPPATDQFDTTGLPPRAAEQIAASRAHLHDEPIASKLLTRFHGTPQTIAAWVLTPPGYDPAARTTYPTVYEAGGFGTNHKLDGQQLSQIWHLMETHAIPPMIWVCLDYASATGTTEFADSAGNGPWGRALIREVIPTLEARYRMDARPSGRFLTGHSSGGWFALWTIVQHPELFGGSWPTSPDPVDFRDFLGVDLSAPGANLYRNAAGAPRPMVRDHDKVLATIEQSAKLEAVLGDDGGQLRSFEWVFSPRLADGTPALLFDRKSGAVDPAVAAYWHDHYDISHLVEAASPWRKHDLDGKIHLTVGAVDSFYLDGPVRLLDAALRRTGIRADITYVPGATHSMSQVYARGGDRIALYKDMANAMYAIARAHPSAR